MVPGLRPRLYQSLQWLGQRTFRRYFRLEVIGLEHWPAAGPLIICPKHQRWEDIPIIGLTFPRPLYFIAKVELFRQFWSRGLIRALGGIPLDRRCPQATLSTFRLVKNLLQGGQQLVLFPEGTYYPGAVGPGRHRFIRLLLRYQHRWGSGPLPFLPVGIKYLPRSPGYEVRVRLAPTLSATGPEQASAFTDLLLRTIKTLQE